MAESEQELKSLLRMKEESEKAGLKLHVSRKIETLGKSQKEILEINTDTEMKNAFFGGSLITLTEPWEESVSLKIFNRNT